MTLNSTELWALLFPSCACTLDEERAHFIRRLPNNMGSFALVISNEMADKISPDLQTEQFYIQRIHSDNLHYAILWETNEWRHSDERKMENAQRFIATDASYVTKKVFDYRKELIVIELSKLKLFTKAKSYELAEAITTKGEDAYKEKADSFHKAFKGVFEGVNIYFSIQQVAKLVDINNVLKYDNQETTVEGNHADEESHEESLTHITEAG